MTDRKTDRNSARLKKSYNRLCTVTQKKIALLDETTDIKVLKEAFAAVKEGVNIGQLLSGEDGSFLTVIFGEGIQEAAM